MKRSFASLLVLFVVLFSSLAFAAQKVIIYCDDGYPPYAYKDGSQAKGIYVDVLNQAFAKMPDYEVEIKPVPWKRATGVVKDGTGVAVFPPYYTEERLAWMLFSEPILQEQVVVFGTPDKLAGKTKWPEDFYGTSVALNAGFNPASMGGAAFDEAVKSGKIKIDEGKDNDTCLKKLELGRTDFYINDRLIDISKYPSITRGIVANTNHGYLGFTNKTDKFPFIPDFKEKFDAIIKEMKASGEVEAIVSSYIK